jgi:hypothetical protein
MKKWLFGLAVLPFLAGVSLAGQPAPLSDTQMDKVTAGFDFLEVTIQNLGSKIVAINLPPLLPCTGCFLNIQGTPFPDGRQSFQLQAQFGP